MAFCRVGRIPPLLSRLATPVSRLPSNWPCPDEAVMFRQMSLVSTLSPSTSRWIGSRWSSRIGVVLPFVAPG